MAKLSIGCAGAIAPRQLVEESGYAILDVRQISEFESGHIAGAVHTYVGHLQQRLDDLEHDPSQPVTVTCSVGHRTSLGVSILKRHGYRHAVNLLGGMTAWPQLELPTVCESEQGKAA